MLSQWLVWYIFHSTEEWWKVDKKFFFFWMLWNKKYLSFVKDYHRYLMCSCYLNLGTHVILRTARFFFYIWMKTKIKILKACHHLLFIFVSNLKGQMWQKKILVMVIFDKFNSFEISCLPLKAYGANNAVLVIFFSSFSHCKLFFFLPYICKTLWWLSLQ